jgi:hypothetical protein
MWSGPRNISTAMMRSWENRPDCCVVDEPFYACYLHESGADHPARDEVIKSQSIERKQVVRKLSADEFPAEIFYQKHMTHHMPAGVDLSWCRELRHCFLIRNPAEVVASYLQKMPTVSEEAIGIVRQSQLFDELTLLTGERPLVIDSNDVLKNPREILGSLCDHWGIQRHSTAMLQWPSGGRDSDGLWARHWYQAVEASTGFAPYRERLTQLTGEPLLLAQRMHEYYQSMAQSRILPS